MPMPTLHELSVADDAPVGSRRVQRQSSDYRPADPGHSGSRLAATAFQCPNLHEADERRLLTEYRRNPDAERREECLVKLSLAYGKMVVSMAAKYRRTPHETNDLISVGLIGLLEAINDFDLKRIGVRLGTYATFRIKHQMQTYIRQNSQPVCLPDTTPHRQLIRHSRRLFEDAERACKREGSTSNRTELCKRVAARVGLSVYDVESTLQLLGGNHVFLDDDPHGSPALPILFAASHEETVVSAIDSGRMKRRVLALMDEILGTSERRVFHARCMTVGEPERLDELATELGVSPERIYQLEASAKRKISVALARQGFLHGDPTALIGETRVRASRRKSKQPAVLQLEAAAAE